MTAGSLFGRSLVVILTVLTMQTAQGSHATLPDGVTPAMATWLWGYHTVPGSVTKDGSPRLYSYPHTDAGRINNPPWTEVAAQHMKAGANAPAILLMHGCAGVVRGDIGHRAYLMSEGYALFEPDSLARPGRPPCNRGRGGYANPAVTRNQILAMRREEITYALRKIRELQWVDHEHIVLMGISEGGRAVGAWEQVGFAAHVILAARCVETNKIPRAPDDVPVLAIIGSEDGRGCNVTRTVGGSKSIVVPDAPHDIMNRREVREALDVFLRECCK